MLAHVSGRAWPASGWLSRVARGILVSGRTHTTAPDSAHSTVCIVDPPGGEGDAAYQRGRKRKVALSVGYLGTDFHGLTLNIDRPEIPTVDGQLLQALLRVGVVAPRNAVNINKKVHWNRSSRTDKGVHSCATIITLRCELRPHHLPDEKSNSAAAGAFLPVPHLTSELNDALPPAVRVFDAVRVPKSFTGRRHMSSRTYEYLFPLDRLVSACAESAESVLARVNDHCGCFVGSYNFHNFTSMRILKEAMHQRDTRRVQAGEITAEEMARVEVALGQGKGLSLQAPEQAPYAAPGELFRTIKRFQCDVVPVAGREFVRLTVTANSFLYHQIRLMVGYAVLATVHRLPTDAFRVVSGRIPVRSIPLAPAEGLTLVNCSLRKSGVDYPDLLSPASQDQARAFLPRIYEAIAASAVDGGVFDKFVVDACYRHKAMEFVNHLPSLIAEADRLGALAPERTRVRPGHQNSKDEKVF